MLALGRECLPNLKIVFRCQSKRKSPLLLEHLVLTDKVIFAGCGMTFAVADKRVAFTMEGADFPMVSGELFLISTVNSYPD